MIKTIELELDELDVLLCITGIAYDFDDSDIINIIDNVVECLISDMKGLPSEYKDLDECKKDAAIHVKKILGQIIEKLGGG